MDKNKKLNPIVSFGRWVTRGLRIDQASVDNTGYTPKTNLATQYTIAYVERILGGADAKAIRQLSNFFFLKSGIYQRAIRYLANIFNYDYLVFPILINNKKFNKATEKSLLLDRYDEVLEFFNKSEIKMLSSQIAQKIAIQGGYFGYLLEDVNDRILFQELPINYCRSTHSYLGRPITEFNVKFFDEQITDAAQRQNIIDTYPKEIGDFYKQLKTGKLKREYSTDTDDGWVVLDYEKAYCFSFTDDFIPPVAYAIAPLVRLQDAIALVNASALQELEKLLVVKYPLDKNGEVAVNDTLITEWHQSIANVISEITGVNSISTVADIKIEDVKSSTEAASAAQKAVQTELDSVFNELGISKNLFNATGNLSLDKSAKVDETYVKTMIYQLERCFQNILSQKFPGSEKNPRFEFKFLGTTMFNYEELSDRYKQLTTLGFSKMLPMLALGHSPEEVLSTANFENKTLDLDFVMQPPLASNNMSPDVWLKTQQAQQASDPARALSRLLIDNPTPETTETTPIAASTTKKTATTATAPITQTKKATTTSATKKSTTETEPKKGGRPKLPESKQSDKTIANKAAKG